MPIKISAKKLIQLENQFGAHNYHPLPVVLSKGKGVYLWDVDGKKYFDFLAGYGAVNQGHCHPKIIKAASDQLKKLTLTSRAFYNDQLGLAEEKICKFFKYDKVLFMNSGAEANETALKIARKWGYEKKKVPQNQAIILAAKGNFHGRTLAVISASTDTGSTDGFGPFLPGYKIIEFGNTDQLETEIKNPNVVAVWLEPIQGEAGVKLPPDGYLKKAAELAKKYNVLTLIDEIQTGIGRTGKLNASEYDGIKPDLLILGKSLSGGILPISAVLAQDTIMEVITPGTHGSTFGGNPLAAKIVCAALDVVKSEKLVQNSYKMGNLFRKELAPLQQLGWVKEIRGRGLMNAIELNPETAPCTAYELCIELMKNGLLAKPTHETIIRLTPPLVINEKELKAAVRIIRKIFESQ